MLEYGIWQKKVSRDKEKPDFFFVDPEVGILITFVSYSTNEERYSIMGYWFRENACGVIHLSNPKRRNWKRESYVKIGEDILWENESGKALYFKKENYELPDKLCESFEKWRQVLKEGSQSINCESERGREKGRAEN